MSSEAGDPAGDESIALDGGEDLDATRSDGGASAGGAARAIGFGGLAMAAFVDATGRIGATGTAGLAGAAGAIASAAARSIGGADDPVPGGLSAETSVAGGAASG